MRTQLVVVVLLLEKVLVLVLVLVLVVPVVPVLGLGRGCGLMIGVADTLKGGGRAHARVRGLCSRSSGSRSDVGLPTC